MGCIWIYNKLQKRIVKNCKESDILQNSINQMNTFAQFTIERNIKIENKVKHVPEKYSCNLNNKTKFGVDIVQIKLVRKYSVNKRNRRIEPIS